VSVFLPKDDPDTRISGGIFFQNLPHMRHRGGVIGNTEFPMGIELRDHRIETLPEPAFIDIENRNDDRKKRRIGQRSNRRVNARLILRGQAVLLDPDVVNIVRIAAFLHTGLQIMHQRVDSRCDDVRIHTIVVIHIEERAGIDTLYPPLFDEMGQGIDG